MQHRLLDATQVLATIERDGEPYEVCVEAEEAHALASDIFASWKRRVTAMLPS